MSLLDDLKNLISPPAAQAQTTPVKKSWTDKLRPASFRGAAFYIDSSVFTAGRRVTFHEFPNRDVPYAEDLGQVGKTWKVEAYVLGNDYWTAKEALVKALDLEGPGQLVHPYYGTLQVQTGAITVEENRSEGAFAKISFMAYEAGDNSFPKQVEDKQNKVEEAAAVAVAASKSLFDRVFSIAKAPGFVVDSANFQLNRVADTIKNAAQTVTNVADGVADLAFGIRQFKATVADLMKLPSQLSQQLLEAFRLLQAAIADPFGQYTADMDVSAFDASNNFPADTVSRIIEFLNNEAITDFILQISTANAAVAVSQVDLADSAALVLVREQLQTNLEQIMTTTKDDDVYQAYSDLHAAIIDVLPDPDLTLANVQNITVDQTTNSLILCYDLFENPDSEVDLIARNKIKNPGFIMSGTLEVLDVRASS